MKCLKHLILIAAVAVMLLSLLAACANPIGSRTSTRSNQLPASVQPPSGEPTGGTAIQADPQADAIEQALIELDNQLKSTDTLDDLK